LQIKFSDRIKQWQLLLRLFFQAQHRVQPITVVQTASTGTTIHWQQVLHHQPLTKSGYTQTTLQHLQYCSQFSLVAQAQYNTLSQSPLHHSQAMFSLSLGLPLTGTGSAANTVYAFAANRFGYYDLRICESHQLMKWLAAYLITVTIILIWNHARCL
jgi:hypothetical protein